MAGNQFYVCAWHVGGGYGPNLIVSNGWKSILCVCMACEGGYGTNLIVSNGWKSIICVHGMWRRVQSKPDCVKLLEINPMCVHCMQEEDTVQTWLHQMPWNQSYVCMVCGRRYGPNPIVSNGWKSILRVCMGCEGGYGTNLIVSNGWKSIICVHGMWRRVQSKSDRVKWLEIKPMCVHVFMVCEGGYRPNLIVSNGWKSSLYVCIVCYMYFVK